MADWDPFGDPADASTADTEERSLEGSSADGVKLVDDPLEEDSSAEVVLNPWEDGVYVEQVREAVKEAAVRQAAVEEAANEREAARDRAEREAAEREVAERQQRVAARETKREAEALTPEERKAAERQAWIEEASFEEAMDAVRSAPEKAAVRRKARLEEFYEREQAGEEPTSRGDREEETGFRESAARMMAAGMGIRINFGSKGTSETGPVGLLFPDQSSRSLRLLSAARNLPGVPEMLGALEEALGFDVLEPVPIQGVWELFRGPEAIPVWLEETSLCQPVMFVSALASVERLKERKPRCLESCQAVAGLSLGELAALTFAGVFDFQTGLQLAKLRGEAMQEAAEAVPQRMLSVAGLDQATLCRLCEVCSREEEGGVCQVAQSLFPDGFLCGGTASAMEALLDRVRTTEGCKQATLLKAAGMGAFHTPLMAPARARLLQALQSIEGRLQPPRCDVYLGVHAQRIPRGAPPSQVVVALAEQLTNCVLWEETVRAMLRDGVGQFYECGPMQQLKGMMKRIDERAFSTMLSLDHVVRNQKEKLPK